MGGEVSNFLAVWTIAVALLSYCFKIGRLTSKGVVRLLLLLPVIAFFFILPSNLYSIFLGVPTYFFLSWLTTFKLLLFVFGNGPLSTNPPIRLSHFVSVACLPIKIRQSRSSEKSRATVNDNHKENPSPRISKKFLKSPLNYATKLMILTSFASVHEHRDQIHSKLLLLFYGIHMYLGLEVLLTLVGAVSSSFLGVAIDVQFDEPYLSTSLQDFWGRRWNLPATNILRPTVYDPVMYVFSRWIGRKWARLPAVIATFLVSGIMHELILYYIGRHGPTWEMTCFFLLNGFGLGIEIALKEILKGKWKMPHLVSWLLTVSFLVSSGLWMFVPSLVRYGVDTKARTELAAFSEFIKEVFEGWRNTCFHIIHR